jgi:hypothetical protein
LGAIEGLGQAEYLFEIHTVHTSPRKLVQLMVSRFKEKIEKLMSTFRRGTRLLSVLEIVGLE